MDAANTCQERIYGELFGTVVGTCGKPATGKLFGTHLCQEHIDVIKKKMIKGNIR